MTTTPQAALLREAAQIALITLDGISNANPRDKADFETPDEWIAWAKSRARFAADALREPISQEVYAERILRQMLHESDHAQATQAEPVQEGELPDEREAFEAWARKRGYQRDELDRCRIGIVGPAYYNSNTEMAWQAWQARAALATHQQGGK